MTHARQLLGVELRFILFKDSKLFHGHENIDSTLFRGLGSSLNFKLWSLWLLIRIGDSCKVLDDSFSCLLIQPFNVSLFTNLQISSNMTFDKWQSLILMNFPSELSISLVWRYESYKTNLPTHCKQFGHLCNSSNVFGSIFMGKTKIIVKTCSNDVSVKNKHFLIAALS